MIWARGGEGRHGDGGGGEAGVTRGMRWDEMG